jgi:aryl-alcohol dehydrogenase-like predicted oxidoreductase
MINNEPANRLVLGTAQIGMPYGIANQIGQPNQKTAYNILQCAWENGIRTLDTAQAYGESEKVIGKFLKAHPECNFEIISKLRPDIDVTSVDAIKDAIRKTTEHLGQVPSGLLFHNPVQLKHWEGPLGETLIKLKKQREINNLGISIYQIDDFHPAIEHSEICWIQAPFNVLDQRLIEKDLIEDAAKNQVHIFLRSIFLQGLLLLDPNSLPNKLGFASDILKKWHSLCQRHSLSPQRAALLFALSIAPQATIVIGCESVSQLEDNIKTTNLTLPNKEFMTEALALRTNNSRLIDPSNWT